MMDIEKDQSSIRVKIRRDNATAYEEGDLDPTPYGNGRYYSGKPIQVEYQTVCNNSLSMTGKVFDKIGKVVDKIDTVDDVAREWINKQTEDWPINLNLPDGTISALLAIAAVAIVTLTIRLIFTAIDGFAPTPPPTGAFQGKVIGLWEGVKSGYAKVLGIAQDKIKIITGRRSEDGSLQITNANAGESYQMLQTLSTTSGATITTMIVSQLQAGNYNGAMPTMVTTTVASVTDGGSSGDSNESDNMMILIAVVIAAVCLLLALLVIGGLVFLWKRTKQPVQNQEQATPHEITMGSVGVSMNPMHAAATKPLEETTLMIATAKSCDATAKSCDD